MKRLIRPAAPACLDGYDHKTQNWAALSSANKREIRSSLVEMQGCFCAYCECKILGDIPNMTGNVKQHIEHFRRKAKLHFPALTFQWDNLFLCCWKGGLCGRYKDTLKEIDHDMLIKPDEENPEEHLLFMESGRVRPRCSDETRLSHQKALETIRVFRLNGEKNPLRYERQNAIKSSMHFQETVEGYLDELGDEEALELIKEELENLRGYPYFTAIKHCLLPKELHLSIFN